MKLDPHAWEPTERAIRQFADAMLDDARFPCPGTWPGQADIFLRLATKALASKELLADLGRERADELLFLVTCRIYIESVQSESLIRDYLGQLVRLFRSRAALSPTGHSCYMVWDNVTPRGPQRAGVQDALFAAMSEVLALPDADTQKGALHGLSHLQYERSVPLIIAFAEQCTDEDLRQYALAAARFELL